MLSLRRFMIPALLIVWAATTLDAAEFCRSRGKMLEVEDFRLETCFLCYGYMPKNQFKVKWVPTTRNNQSQPQLTDGNGTQTTADVRDMENPLLDSFVDEMAEQRWIDCCEAAEDCCQQIKLPSESEVVSADSQCPPTWDGWQCWSQGGEAGHVAYESCPSYIFFSAAATGHEDSCGRYAQKQCDADGRWHFRARGGEWTDFTTCSRVNALLTREYVHISLYAVSIIALVPAIIIFFSYKVLRVPRIAIHKNLFASLSFHCIIMIIFKSLVLLPYIQNNGHDETMLQENTFGCQYLLMLSKYFRLTNYTWMFCEGYYLHRLLVNTFEEERSLKAILSIGWVLPMIPCLAYGILRVYVDNTLCWALPASSHEWVEWIYMTPGLLCILSNFVFFLNIFRILVTKLQAPHANEPAHFRKAVHATVVLLPLFGLHWLLTLYRPPEGGNCFWNTFYKYLNVILDGLQGLMVSIAFCYRNGEIRLLLKQTKKRFMERFFPNSSSQNHIPMKKLSRKHSETYVTQVGFSTTGSRLGSRYSLDTDSPSPRGGSTNNLGPSFKTGAKTTLEVRKSNVSFHSVDSV